MNLNHFSSIGLGLYIYIKSVELLDFAQRAIRMAERKKAKKKKGRKRGRLSFSYLIPL